MASYSALFVVVGALGMAMVVALLIQGGTAHQEEQALANYKAYLLEARQLSDAGQSPPPPEGVPLPEGYDMTLADGELKLEKDGNVIKVARYRRLNIRSGFDERYSLPPGVAGASVKSGPLWWSFVRVGNTDQPDWCGDIGVVNESDYISGSYDCAPREGLATAYLRGSSRLISEPVGYMGVEHVELTFWWRGRSFDGGTERATVKVFDGQNWHEVICMEDASAPSAGCARVDDEKWHREEIDVTEYANGTASFAILFEGSPGPWDDLWVDSVALHGGW